MSTHYTRIDINLGKNVLKKCLQTHFNWAYKRGEVSWPKNAADYQKTKIPAPIRRVKASLYAQLYHKKSDYRFNNKEIGQTVLINQMKL